MEAKSSKLKNNENQAKVRLNNLSHKLAKDPKLQNRYDVALTEIETSGIITEVKPEEICVPYPVFYMPHRPVVRESSLTTKVRPVFDASAKGHNGISLNDCMEAGPCLIPSLVEILIRFRRWKVALTSDITKAFLQIQIRREDQDVHRFFWNHNGLVRIMRFLRVPFGNKCSPYLLNATVQHHLASFPLTNTVEELKENLYVDDWLSGADSDYEACQMFSEACEIMKKAGMQLSKWNSNSEKVSDQFSKEISVKHEKPDFVKILGMKWLPHNNSFSFDGVGVPSESLTTKRLVLSCIARLFDPLGLLNPFTMVVKILFQKLWRISLDWDEKIPLPALRSQVPNLFAFATGCRAKNYLQDSVCSLAHFRAHARPVWHTEADNAWNLSEPPSWAQKHSSGAATSGR